MWQKLYEELKDQNFMIIAVAMESRGSDSARRPIKNAKTTYTSLIDTDHVVADLYNMVNVPQAVWIDESGKIVRPTEIAGASQSTSLRKIKKAKKDYCNAIRDWVQKGEESQFIFSEKEARNRLPTFTPEIALAHANFHLGQYLWNHGNQKEAAKFLQNAVELNPDSWNFYRQMKNLKHIWGSAGPGFIRRVHQFRKAGKKYYPPPDLGTMARN